MLRDKNWMQCTIPDWSFSDSNKYYQGHNLEIWGIWIWVYIRPGVNKLFYKGPDNKCFRLCGSDILSQFFKSALVGQGRHRQYISIKCYLQKKKKPQWTRFGLQAVLCRSMLENIVTQLNFLMVITTLWSCKEIVLAGTGKNRGEVLSHLYLTLKWFKMVQGERGRETEEKWNVA